jgi:hypothetical protein
VNTRYCSICSSSFDVDEVGCEGSIGIIPFAFCCTCRVGIWEWAQISFDLVPNPDDWHVKEEPVPEEVNLLTFSKEYGFKIDMFSSNRSNSNMLPHPSEVHFTHWRRLPEQP